MDAMGLEKLLANASVEKVVCAVAGALEDGQCDIPAARRMHEEWESAVTENVPVESGMVGSIVNDGNNILSVFHPRSICPVPSNRHVF